MYIIEIKGSNRKVEVSDDFGKKIKAQWEQWIEDGRSQEDDGLISTDGFSGSFSQVKFIYYSSEKNRSDNTNNSFGDYQKDRDRIRKMTPEQKAKRLGFFRIIYWGFTKKRSEEVKTKTGESIEKLAENIQLKFFKENPNRTLPDEHIFKPLIKSTEMDNRAFKVVSDHVQEDINAIKFVR